jgi:hypothetical protein
MPGRNPQKILSNYMNGTLNKYANLVSMLIFLAVLFVSCDAQNPMLDSKIAPEAFSEHNQLKLITTQEGMYLVSLSDLGWGEDAIESVSLTHKGQPVSFLVDEHGIEQNIIFFGQPPDSIYTPENVYILQRNLEFAHQMSSQVVSEPDLPEIDQFISTLHFEQNNIYTPKIDNGSPWHWNKIIAPQSQTIEVDLPYATGGPGSLRVAFYGITTSPTSPSHHVRVHVNGNYVSEAAWDGQAWFIIDARIPENVLVDGINTIEIEATGDIDARIDIVNLDWIEIEYRKSSLEIKPQEIFQVSEIPVLIAGFSEPLDIFDIFNPINVSRFEVPKNQQGSIIFQGEPDHRYIAVHSDGYLNLENILPVNLFPNLRAEPGADYLAIGQKELLEPLEELLDYRAEHGLSTLAIPIESVYDQFNGGLAEPAAIQQFLKFAVSNWTEPPKYVLLVGDASYDFLGYQTPINDRFVPTFMVKTVFGGETGSDVIMTQVNGDPWPDLAIGRVPARTIEQVESFVSKTISFERNSPLSEWNRSILAIADGQEPRFKSDAISFINHFPEDYQSQFIAPEPGFEGANQEIRSEIENGKLLTAYFGHGSINMWGKDSLFNTDDIADMTNVDRQSLILNFTCLTGLFTHPTEESMAESLLLNPNGGAVAVLAPTSPTLPTDQTFLSDALIEAMFQEHTARLGDILLYAWRKVPTNSESAVDVMQTFLLFGDPALLLPVR